MSHSLLVAVDGATGYLGNHLVARLRQSGVDVRAIVHPGAKERDVEFLRSTGAEVVVASLTDEPSGLKADRASRSEKAARASRSDAEMPFLPGAEMPYLLGSPAATKSSGVVASGKGSTAAGTMVAAGESPLKMPIAQAFSGVDVAVHLIGSIAPPKGQNLEDLHGKQTSNLVAAAKQAGVKKIVQVTALGTSANASSRYHGTKWEAEEHVRSSGLNWVILRPSLIVGRQVGNRNSKLITRYIDLIGKRSSVPVIGGGKNRLQPVFIGDLVQALEKAIVTSSFDNKVYEIGGDEILSMRQIVQKLMNVLKENKNITGVSPFAAGILACICEAVQNVPTISRDQIKLSMSDNICADNALRSVFTIAPTSMDEALGTYGTTGQSGGVLESSGNRR